MTRDTRTDAIEEPSTASSDTQVVYVDPDGETAAAIASAIEERTGDATVRTATSIADCVRLLQEDATECVVSEHRLPDGDGLLLLETIRDEHPGLPFVLYTADGSETLASEAISAGTTEYLSKERQGSVERLAKTVETLLVEEGARERERRLRLQRDLTERILDTVPVGVAVHSPAGDIVRANARARELLETIEDSIERERDRSGDRGIYNADGTPLSRSDLPVRRVFETGESVVDETMRFERSDGDPVWLSVTAVPMYGDEESELSRVITASRNVTALKERERKLRRTEEELREAVDELERTNQRLELVKNRFDAFTTNSPYAVVTIDETSTVQFANETVEDILGYAPTELVGESLTKLMPDRLVSKHERGIERYIETGERRLDWEWVELPGQHKDGHEVELGLSFGDIAINGDHLFTGVIRDITEQKERQRELEQRRSELSELVDELERSNAELERFAYAVSHDLKEPLRMVTNYLQLLERRYDDELDEDATEYIDYAVDGADRLKRMIDDLLAYARVGAENSTFEPVDCNDALADVLRLLPQVRDAADVTADDLPTVHGNRTQIVQVFQNLISNAITHSEGEVDVHVTADREGDEWRVTVSDDGPGIHPEKQTQVFDLFTGIGETSGTGVGLATCKKIVEYHDGDIYVDSTPGEGATFSFTLPVVDSAEADGQER